MYKCMLWGLRQVEAPAPADLRGMGELGCRPLKWRLLYKLHLPPVFFINVYTYRQSECSIGRSSLGVSNIKFNFDCDRIALMLKYSVQKRAEAVQCFVWNYLIGVMSKPCFVIRKVSWSKKQNSRGKGFLHLRERKCLLYLREGEFRDEREYLEREGFYIWEKGRAYWEGKRAFICWSH